MPYRPKLDPKVDLAGATPETLARALLRRVEPLCPGTRGKPVVGDDPNIFRRRPRPRQSWCRDLGRRGRRGRPTVR